MTAFESHMSRSDTFPSAPVPHSREPDEGPEPSLPRTFPLERDSDGHFLAGNGQVHPPSVSWRDLPPMLPDNGAPVSDRVIFVNGICTDCKRQYGDMRALANSGAAVIGLHNSTFGPAADVLEYLGDRLGAGHSPTIRTLMGIIRESAISASPLHIVCHSQGALMVGQALTRSQDALMSERGIGREEAEKRFAHMRIETYGGGAAFYPNGPQYVHVDNQLDPVCAFLGLGPIARMVNPRTAGGRDAVYRDLTIVNRDRDAWLRRGPAEPSIVDRVVHGLRTIYFPNRISFDRARAEGTRDARR